MKRLTSLLWLAFGLASISFALSFQADETASVGRIILAIAMGVILLCAFLSSKASSQEGTEK